MALYAAVVRLARTALDATWASFIRAPRAEGVRPATLKSYTEAKERHE